MFAMLFNMNNEGQFNQTESQENTAEIFDREIRRSLSPVWAKSTQELLPGYLPDKPRGEYAEDELARYKIAFTLLGEMAKRGEVEVSFEEEVLPSMENSPMNHETIAIPRFKLVTSGGKKSMSPSASFNGELVADAQ